MQDPLDEGAWQPSWTCVPRPVGTRRQATDLAGKPPFLCIQGNKGQGRARRGSWTLNPAYSTATGQWETMKVDKISIIVSITERHGFILISMINNSSHRSKRCLSHLSEVQ